MGFGDGDLKELFEAVGREIQVELGGIVIATLTGRIKKEVVDASPFDATAGVPVPILTCPTSALSGITTKHVLVDGAARYKIGRDAHPMDAGFSRVYLTGAK